MLENTAIELEKEINRVIEYYIPLIQKAGIKPAGDIVNVNPTSIKESSFDPVQVQIDKLKKAVTSTITNRIEGDLRQIEKVYGIKIERSVFFADLKKKIDLALKLLQSDIESKVLKTTLTTEATTNKAETKTNLLNSLSSTISSNASILTEAMTIAVRKKNDEAFKKAEEKGDMYLFSHVKDSKNSPFCRDHGNEIRTREDWVNIKSDIFVNGGHYACRGIMVLVKEDEIDEVKKEVEAL